jgi:hypothetical protein
VQADSAGAFFRRRTLNIERPTSNAATASLWPLTKSNLGHWLLLVKKDSRTIKIDSMPYSTFEIGRSMFDVNEKLSATRNRFSTTC